jgi:hypothetical protein
MQVLNEKRVAIACMMCLLSMGLARFVAEPQSYQTSS